MVLAKDLLYFRSRTGPGMQEFNIVILSLLFLHDGIVMMIKKL